MAAKPSPAPATTSTWIPAAAAAAVFVLAQALFGFPLVLNLILAGVTYVFLSAKPAGRATDLYLAENLEALAISIAMALILKFFVIEAYQIPTGSMQPNILGDSKTGIMDRILADKLITMLRPPERWEVMIFRFPLDERRLYVKRIVGLPGETLEILGGDVWIDGAIARKPDHVNDSVLKRLQANGDEGLEISRYFGAEGAVETRGTKAVFGTAGGRLETQRPVTDDYLHGYDPDWGIDSAPGNDHAVADLELALDASLADASGTLTLVLQADDADLAFILPGRDSSEAARLEFRPRDGSEPRTLPAEGQPTLGPDSQHVVARHVDRRAVLWVDGQEWLRWNDDESGPRADRPRRSGAVIALDGAGQVDDVMLRRDIFYLPATKHYPNPQGRWEIPGDSYFGLGDNTQKSHDSRTWQTRTYRLSDGRSFSGFWFPPPKFGPAQSDANYRPLPDGRLAFADVHGDTFYFRPDEVVSESLEQAPFINQRYLLGKASAVFWPVFRPFRWKLIR